MTHAQAQSKIEKLLRLANDKAATPGEKRAARARADALRRKYPAPDLSGSGAFTVIDLSSTLTAEMMIELLRRFK